MSNKKRTSVSLNPRNASYLKEHDNASKLVDDLVEKYREGDGSRDYAALELRLKQKREEREEVQRKLERVDQEIADIEELLSEWTADDRSDVREAIEKLSDTPRDPDNPAVQTWAEKLEMTPARLVEILEDHTS